MAMNKKEKEMVYDLEVKCSLRLTEPVFPDIEIPEYGKPNTKGFMMNSYSMSVNKACSSASGHNTSSDVAISSQAGIKLFSTKLLALKAMRYEVEMRCAKELHKIDIMIEDDCCG